MESEKYCRIRKYIDGEMTSREIRNFLRDLELDADLHEDFLFEQQLSEIKLFPESDIDPAMMNVELKQFIETSFKEWQTNKASQDIQNALNSKRHRFMALFLCACIVGIIVLLVVAPSATNIAVKNSSLSPADANRAAKTNPLLLLNAYKESSQKIPLLLSDSERLRYNVQKIALVHNELNRLVCAVNSNIIQKRPDQSRIIQKLQTEVNRSSAKIHALLTNTTIRASHTVRDGLTDSSKLVVGTAAARPESFKNIVNDNTYKIVAPIFLSSMSMYSLHTARAMPDNVLPANTASSGFSKNSPLQVNYFFIQSADTLGILDIDSPNLFELLKQLITKDSYSYVDLHRLIVTNNLGIKRSKFEQELDELKDKITMLARCSSKEYTDCFNNIGCIYKEKGDYSTAVKYYETALDLSRNFTYTTSKY